MFLKKVVFYSGGICFTVGSGIALQRVYYAQQQVVPPPPPPPFLPQTSMIPSSAFTSGVAVYEPYTANRLLRYLRNTTELFRMIWILIPVVFTFLFRNKSKLLPSVYQAIIRLGPCYVKLAQWASTRLDLFGVDVVNTLKLMTYDAPEHSYEETMKQIEGITSEIKDVSVTPIGSGCVAQVHTATHIATGQKVVVKVLHPHIYDDISVSLDLMYAMSTLVDAVYPHLAFHEAILEFSSFMRSQLDLRNEIVNLIAFRKNFATSTEVSFPLGYPELTSERFLVESYEKGIRCDEYLLSSKDSNHPHSIEERKFLADIGIRMFLKMIFIDNFIHGDLHPGNMLVRPDGKGLIILDPGLTTSLLPEDRMKFLELFSAVSAGDGRLGAKLMLEKSKYHHCVDEAGYLEDMDRIFTMCSSSGGFQLSRLDVGAVLTDMLNSCNRHQIHLESSFTTLCACIAVLEGVGRQLDPSINIYEVAAPILIQVLPATSVPHLIHALRNRYKLAHS